MRKKLSDMSNEELWELFPLVLTEHNPEWEVWYYEEEAQLKKYLPEYALINHIGSTSVKGIWAKPIVDIVIEVPDAGGLTTVCHLLKNRKYRCMKQSESRALFYKGYNGNGYADRIFHLYIRMYDDNDELYFRDYLKEHEEIRKEYEALKVSLWKAYGNNRDGYTDAKTEFVKKYTALARTEYGDRYWGIDEDLIDW